MTELNLAFTFEQLDVRTITNETGIWFVLKDVCFLLGIKNHRFVWERIDDDERGVGKIYTPGGTQEMQIVNEPGLYDVIIRSNSEKAKPFRRWITHEVIPSIRKQGYYALMSDEQLLDVIVEKARRERNFLDKIDKVKIRHGLLADSRQIKDEEIRQLWINHFDEYDMPTFRKALKDVCVDDMTMFHKYIDKYMSDLNKKKKGHIILC